MVHGLHPIMPWTTLKDQNHSRRAPRGQTPTLLAVGLILTLSLTSTACAVWETARQGPSRPEPALAEAGPDTTTSVATSATVAAESPATKRTTRSEPMPADGNGAEPGEAPGRKLEGDSATAKATTRPEASQEADRSETMAATGDSVATAPSADTTTTATAAETGDPAATEASGPAPTTAAVATKTDAAAASSKKSATTAKPAASGSARRYRAGEDPDFAARMGWPVKGPEPLPGAIFPHKRVVAYYGNPLSRRMGILGEYDPEEMLRRLDETVAAWEKADPATPVVPALHLIAVVAQAEPGPSGKYRLRMRDSLIETVSRWAETRDALVFLDVQVGTSTLQEELPRLIPFLRRPNFHLGIDPEFSMKDGTPPGKKIGTFDAADINYATQLLANLVREHDLPPKILVVHRFTRRMVTNSQDIELRPEVQIVMHMDGWGAPWLKRDSYREFIVREPVQFPGFKIFYKNDVRQEGWTLMSPEDVLRLRPVPVYIQYQ